jgi:hypothetical protein
MYFRKSIHDSCVEKSSYGIKSSRDKDEPLTVEEIRAELSLLYERFNVKLNDNEKSGELKEHASFCGQLKGKCRNCGRIGPASN